MLAGNRCKMKRENFNVESIGEESVRECIRECLMRSKANADECARFRREQRGELYRIERYHNVVAHSTRAFYRAVREAMR